MANKILYDCPPKIKLCSISSFFKAKICCCPYPPSKLILFGPPKKKVQNNPSSGSFKFFVMSRWFLKSAEELGFKEKGSDSIVDGIRDFVSDSSVDAIFYLLKSGRDWPKVRELLSDEERNGSVVWIERCPADQFLEFVQKFDFVVDQFGTGTIGVGAMEVLMTGVQVIAELDGDNCFSKNNIPLPLNLHNFDSLRSFHQNYSFGRRQSEQVRNDHFFNAVVDLVGDKIA